MSNMTLLPNHKALTVSITHIRNQIDTSQFPDTKPTERGVRILNTSANLEKLLELMNLKPVINRMTLEPEVLYNGVPVHLEMVRSALISATSLLSFPRTAIDDHLTAISMREDYHPVVIWLGDAEWDSVNRVDAAIDCLNCKKKDLARIVMKRWLVGCIASLYEPSFKSKLVPVLHGEQSYMKTAFIERIAKVVPYSFLEGAELNPDHKDSVLSCIRSWIVELGEMERSTKNSQGSLKAFITKEEDTVRPPYAKADIKKPRQSHFIATVNGTDFLKDETGNSRYAVLEMTKAADMDRLNSLLGWKYNSAGGIRQTDLNALRQFWLELKHMYHNGFAWNLTAEERNLIKLEADKHMDKGRWYPVLLDHILDCRDKPSHSFEELTTTSICNYLDIPSGQSNQVGKGLKKLAQEGYLKTRKISGRQRYQFPTVTPKS